MLRTFGSYDVDGVSLSNGLDCSVDADSGEVLTSRAQQSFKEECDINEIVRRFGVTGQLPENVRVPQSGDFTGISDYQSALNAVIAAEDAFMELPAIVRERFDNDPQSLLEFVSDVANRDEAVRLGLVNKPPEVTRDVVTAVDELAARFPKV